MNILGLLCIDWMNAVIIPLIMMLTIGSALAVWTGVIASRYILFFDAKLDAASNLLQNDYMLHEGDAHIALLREAVNAKVKTDFTLQSLGQHKAATELTRIYDANEKAFRARVDAIRSATGSDQNGIAAKTYFEHLNKVSYVELARIKPNYAPILFGNKLFGNLDLDGTPRRSDCGTCCKNCNRTL